MEIKGPAWLCDEIRRDEDANYVAKILLTGLFAYFDPSTFSGKRILDFGSGAGGSSMILARQFPSATIVGVELEDRLIQIARARLAFYGHLNVSFHQSPSGAEIPRGLGLFDFIVLSVVLEHLLSREREALIPQIWSSLRPNGYLFLDQTPNRAFPIELHTTSLPFINYMPRQLAHTYATTLSKTIDQRPSWEQLLREGIRGATASGILKMLRRAGAKATLLRPHRNGLNDRIDLYYANTNTRRHSLLKKAVKVVLKSLQIVTGIELVRDLALAIRKEA